MGPYAICGPRRPRSACAFAQADLGLRCQLIKSTDTVEMSTNTECPDQTARMRMLIWTFAVRIWGKGLFTIVWHVSPANQCVIRQYIADRCPIVHLRQMAMQRVATELDYTVRECAGWSKMKMKMSIRGLMHWTQAYLVPVSDWMI